VGHDTRQLVFSFRESDQFPRQENVSAGRVEGVRRRDVDDEEFELQSRGREVSDEAVADLPDVSEQLLVLYETGIAGHALVVQIAENHLLIGREDVVDLGVCSDGGRVAVLGGGSDTSQANAKQNEQAEFGFSFQGDAP